MILFPSHGYNIMFHKNTSNKDRISIAFNVMLKGIVGSSIDYQSTEF